jgi:hypothetical protein
MARRKSGKNIILVGASSVGPAIHLSLCKMIDRHEFSGVKAWVNLGGILQGSPLIDHYQEWPQRWLFNAVIWYQGWDKEKILSMSVKQSRDRFWRKRKTAASMPSTQTDFGTRDTMGAAFRKETIKSETAWKLVRLKQTRVSASY